MCMEDELVILIPRNNDLVSDRFWMGLIWIIKESQKVGLWKRNMLVCVLLCVVGRGEAHT